jgi:hypothetical protein
MNGMDYCKQKLATDLPDVNILFARISISATLELRYFGGVFSGKQSFSLHGQPRFDGKEPVAYTGGV